MNKASSSRTINGLLTNARVHGSEYKVDVQKAPRFQLLEMLERQAKLASNRKALDQLPDKGAKILALKREIETELEKRESVGDLTAAFSSLRLQLPASVDNIEWSGNCNEEKPRESSEQVDDENNPFKILANHSGAGFHKKEIKIEPADSPLITDKDVEDLYAVHLCSKLDQIQAPSKFLPYKTLNKTQPVVKTRDVTAASQPPSKFNDAKLMSLEESIKLQQEQAKYLKEVQTSHALQRLRDKNLVIGDKLPDAESIKCYREVQRDDDESDDDEEEIDVHDDCEGEDTGAIVNYVLSDLNDVD